MLTRHTHNRRNRNRLLRGRAPRRGGSSLTLRQQIGQVLGVQPQVFADARDLTVGDGNAVSTWGEWTSEGDVVLDTDGWRGMLPAVVSDSGGEFTLATTTDVANYGALTPSVWVVSGRAVTETALHNILTLTRDRDNSIDQRFWGTLASDAQVRFRTRLAVGNQEMDTGDSLSEAQFAHLGVAYDGETVTVVEVTGSGSRTALSSLHGHDVSLEFDELLLGTGIGTWLQWIDRYALTSVTRCAAGDATPANLAAVIALHNQAYPVA